MFGKKKNANQYEGWQYWVAILAWISKVLVAVVAFMAANPLPKRLDDVKDYGYSDDDVINAGSDDKAANNEG